MGLGFLSVDLSGESDITGGEVVAGPPFLNDVGLAVGNDSGGLFVGDDFPGSGFVVLLWNGGTWEPNGADELDDEVGGNVFGGGGCGCEGSGPGLFGCLVGAGITAAEVALGSPSFDD